MGLLATVCELGLRGVDRRVPGDPVSDHGIEDPRSFLMQAVRATFGGFPRSPPLRLGATPSFRPTPPHGLEPVTSTLDPLATEQLVQE